MLQVSATVHLARPDTQWDAHLIDISRSGVAFASARPLADQTPFLLSFWLPGTPQPCAAEGNVVYCIALSNSGLYRIGARFVPLSVETQERIMDFVMEPLLRRAGASPE